MATETTRKQYLTRGKSAAATANSIPEEGESIDNTPLCMSILTPLESQATPLCNSVPTPRTPSTPQGLLGEVFSRRRSTPTSNGGNLPTLHVSPTSTQPTSTSPSVDLLDNINTQTLNELLHADCSISQETVHTRLATKT